MSHESIWYRSHVSESVAAEKTLNHPKLLLHVMSAQDARNSYHAYDEPSSRPYHPLYPRYPSAAIDYAACPARCFSRRASVCPLSSIFASKKPSIYETRVVKKYFESHQNPETDAISAYLQEVSRVSPRVLVRSSPCRARCCHAAA